MDLSSIAGLLSVNSLKDLKSKLKDIDTDQNGELSADEITKASPKLDGEKIVAALDTDDSGGLSADELSKGSTTLSLETSTVLLQMQNAMTLLGDSGNQSQNPFSALLGDSSSQNQDPLAALLNGNTNTEAFQSVGNNPQLASILEQYQNFEDADATSDINPLLETLV